MIREDALGKAFQWVIMRTRNICRSTLAERLARAYVDEAPGLTSWPPRCAAPALRRSWDQVSALTALVLGGFGGDSVGSAAGAPIDGVSVDADVALAESSATAGRARRPAEPAAWH